LQHTLGPAIAAFKKNDTLNSGIPIPEFRDIKNILFSGIDKYLI